MTQTAEQKAAAKAAKEQAKKDALVAELATLNITRTSGTETIAPLTGDETVEKLAELLKAAKAESKGAAKNADFVTVTWNGGTRIYSKADHGTDFVDLAKQFADKFNGTIK